MMAAKWAEGLEFAVGAVGVSGHAAAASMPDEPVAKVGPRLAGKEAGKIRFDFYGVGVSRQPKASSEASDMSINNHAGIDPKGIAKDDIGGFPSDSRQGGKGLQGLRDLAEVVGNQGGGHSAEIFRLVTIKARGVDDRLQFFLGNRGVVFHGFAALEQNLGNQIHPLVGALGRKDRGNKELEGVVIVQLAMRLRINLWKAAKEFGSAGFSCHCKISTTVLAVAPR